MARDDFPTEIADISPITAAAAVTPDDNTDLAEITRALYVGVAGDVTAVMKSGTTVLFSGLAAGQVYPFRFSRIKATGTTASGIVALW